MIDIFQYVFSSIVIVLTGIVLRLVVKRLDESKLEVIKDWVSCAVMAYEQIYKVTGSGSQKKTAVIDFLKQKGVTLSEIEIDVLIEKAVYELFNAQVKK